MEMVVPLGIVLPLGNAIDPVIPPSEGNGIVVPAASGTVVAADVGAGEGVLVGLTRGGLEPPWWHAVIVALATSANANSVNRERNPGRFMNLPHGVTARID
jgi:hypothetical protein